MSSILLPKNKGLVQPGLLWVRWEKILKKDKHRIVLIEADRNISWSAQALSDKADEFQEPLRGYSKGARIAFCLPNGASWVAFFLCLQKLGLSAVPLDAGLPDEACLEMAQRLHSEALFLRGKIIALGKTRRSNAAICCIKVTSGSSGGFPKKILCRAEHLIADGSNIIRTMGIRPNDRNLVTIPLGHSYGLGNFVLPLILQGTSLVCAAGFVPRQLMEWMDGHGVTVFPSVPAIFRLLASMPGKDRFSSLRLAVSAGAPLAAEVAKAFFERYRLKIHNFYGSSETGGICYDRRGDATLSGRSVGKPLAGVVVTVKRGVIEVKSEAVAKCGERWHVPDRGEWNEKGEIVLIGRRGREANIGGKKVHPSEVEIALRTVPGVMDAVVWVASNLDRSFLLAAVETRLSLMEVRKALSTKLPEWKFPKRYLITVELPRTTRGKVNLAAIRRKIKG